MADIKDLSDLSSLLDLTDTVTDESDSIPQAQDAPAPEREIDFENPEKYFRSETFGLISTTAYLLGVPKRIFENDHESPKPEYYIEAEKDQAARIIRNLCMIRTAIEKHYREINNEIYYNTKNLNSLPEYIPQEALTSLADDGIQIVKANSQLNDYVININLLIKDRINNIRTMMPNWLNWDYYKDLFIMPGGTKPSAVKNEWYKFSSNIRFYPYQVYLNWHSPKDSGNILYNDKKFVRWLYEIHNDEFKDLSKVTDASEYTKTSIYSFIHNSERTVFVVDCENSDPFKFCGTIRNLDDVDRDKIVKVILYNDVHTTTAWNLLKSYLDIPVEHIMINRLKEEKSLVDMKLAIGVANEFHENDIDSFVIVSSDSDYWALITSLPKAKFIVMAEKEKCGHDFRVTLEQKGIFYCFMDDFFTGNVDDLKIRALVAEFERYVDERVRFNVNDMVDTAFLNTRIELTEAAMKQFYRDYVRTMHLEVDDNGEVFVEFGNK